MIAQDARGAGCPTKASSRNGRKSPPRVEDGRANAPPKRPRRATVKGAGVYRESWFVISGNSLCLRVGNPTDNFAQGRRLSPDGLVILFRLPRSLGRLIRGYLFNHHVPAVLHTALGNVEFRIAATYSIEQYDPNIVSSANSDYAVLRDDVSPCPMERNAPRERPTFFGKPNDPRRAKARGIARNYLPEKPRERLAQPPSCKAANRPRYCRDTQQNTSG